LVEPLPIGSVVMRLDPERKDKREPRYVGPYTITRRSMNGGYVLKDVEGDIVDYPVHIDQLKIAPANAVEDMYVVHRIHDHRGDAGAYEYRVEWKGFHNEDDFTWEPEHHFNNPSIIRKYWEERRRNDQAVDGESQQRRGRRPRRS
jgi:Chromo (CHRromatin Organisation MOdifier) domain